MTFISLSAYRSSEHLFRNNLQIELLFHYLVTVEDSVGLEIPMGVSLGVSLTLLLILLAVLGLILIRKASNNNNNNSSNNTTAPSNGNNNNSSNGSEEANFELRFVSLRMLVKVAS